MPSGNKPPAAHSRVRQTDLAAHRADSPYSRGEQLARVAWGLLRPLYRFSPQPLHGWRRCLLRAFGARLAADVYLHPSARVYFPWTLTCEAGAAIGENVLIYNLGPVHIGARSMISLGSTVCAGSHDDANPAMPLLRSTIHIGDDVWVCAEVFVGPDTRIGAGAVLLPRAVVTRDVPEWTRVGGHPAKVIGPRVLDRASRADVR